MKRDISEKIVIITGTGYKIIKECNEENLDAFDTEFVKANIGAWVAKVLSDTGFEVLMISRTKSKLDILSQSIKKSNQNAKVYFSATDIMDPLKVKSLVEELPKNKDIFLVHCAGLSAGSYKVSYDNPYLSLEDTPADLPSLEYDCIVRSLLILVQSLMPRFKKQKETRIVVNTSMSGIRAVPFGYSHSGAKAGLHQSVRSMTLELNKDNIYISEILPGAVNTGLYDSYEVQNAVVKMGKFFGYDYDYNNIPQMHPKEVAEAVKLCLISGSHILSINMVAKGQWPNMGA
jgi:short-subunit dehydrogenase